MSSSNLAERMERPATDNLSDPPRFEARAALEEGLQISQEYDDQLDVQRNLLQLALLARQQSEFPRARDLLEQALAIQRAFDLPLGIVIIP